MSASDYIHLEVEEIVQESEWALLLRFEWDDSIEETWFPKSQIADADRYKEGDKNCTISVTKWVAKKKGLEID